MRRTLFVLILALLPLRAADDLDARLARFRQVQMPFHSDRLSARERSMVEKLVEACQHLELIYWEQSDPDALSLYRKTADPKLRRLLMINGSRFDLIDEHKPFTGSEPMPPGRALYPKGLTRERIEQYVKDHPEKKAEIYDPYTVVRWRGSDLVGVPYHEVYRSELDAAAKALREAAALSPDKAFAGFLRLRADALLTDNYYPSDLAWLDLKDPKVDLIFAPVRNVPRRPAGRENLLRRRDSDSGGSGEQAAVGLSEVRSRDSGCAAATLGRPSLESGHVTPMEVMDAPFRTGDLRHGYQAVADNLPNDPKIHAEKGTKKIFFKNFMDARVQNVVLPIARKLMRPDHAARVSDDGYLTCVMMHEISHELGPAYARRGEQADRYTRSDRTGLFRPRRSQGGRGRDVWRQVAGR